MTAKKFDRITPVFKRIAGSSGSVRANAPMVKAITGPPASPFARFDPGLGRGYRTGNKVNIPAGAGFSALSPAVVLANHGDASKIFRWKVTLHVSLPTGGTDPPKAGAGLRFLIQISMENDVIPRTCFVTLGDAQPIYAPGRSINVLAFNPNAFSLDAHISLDEYVGGISVWEDVVVFEGNLAAETALTFPPFCGRFQVVTPMGAPAPRITGYAPGGGIVYSEVLAVPRSGVIDRVSGLDYTIAPTGGVPQSHAVLFQCDG